MLRMRAFRPSGEKIVKIQLHPTHPWLVTADDSDHVSVWNWEHRQVIYELRAGGVDQRRLVGARLEKLAEGESEPKGKPTEAIRGGSVKQVNFYDDDVRYWQHWRNRSAASEGPSPVSQHSSAFGSPIPSTRGRHFLVICCENKAIFLDLVTMRGRDVPKQELDNRSLLCMEFLSRSSAGDSPLVAFGGSDGVIRVLSMITWKLVRRYTGGHKGSISCLMTFMASSGEALLVSCASDGLLIIWSADHIHDSRELVPKLSLKAHDGGVVAVELSRVMGSAPQLITIGADKTLAIWDTISFKELRRIKPVPKLACHSVASWCHPRAPNLDILTCVKDSHIWAIEHPTYSALTRPLCELSSLVPPQVLAATKKLRVYCMVAHPLQPHLVATGTNIGVILSEFDPKSLPAVAPLPSPQGSKEHSAVYIVERELKLLNFQLSNRANPSLGSTGSLPDLGRSESAEPLIVRQTKKHISTPAPHDSHSVLSVSSSGKYVTIVWPDIPSFVVYRVSDWGVVDSGTGRHFAWDTCRDRYALLETALAPRMPVILKGSSSKKAAKEAAAAAAQAAAAASSAASSATMQVRILLDEGTPHVLSRSIDGRNEPVIGLHGGALLGVAYRTSRRISPVAATAISSIQTMPLSGFGNSGLSSFADERSSGAEAAPQNFQLYSWETFQPVSGLLSQPEWTAWDQTVEYCAFAYHQYIVISSLRPQYRYLGDVAIPSATGGVWHRRQLFVATPTTIECVFVDAGVAPIDLETKRRKEEIKAKEAQSRAVAEHGELALITVDTPQVPTNERVSLRPPMLQGLVNNLITAGHGREAAFAAAILGDNALMEKAWQDTGMLAEAVLHAHAHGRPTLRTLAQAWNKVLQKEFEPTSHVKTDAATAFLASLEEPKLTNLAEAGKKLPIEILPPGMASLTSPPITIKKSPGPQSPALPPSEKPLMLEAAPPTTPSEQPVVPDEKAGAAPTETLTNSTDAAAASRPNAATDGNPNVDLATSPDADVVSSNADVVNSPNAVVGNSPNADAAISTNADAPSSPITGPAGSEVLPRTTEPAETSLV